MQERKEKVYVQTDYDKIYNKQSTECTVLLEICKGR